MSNENEKDLTNASPKEKETIATAIFNWASTKGDRYTKDLLTWYKDEYGNQALSKIGEVIFTVEKPKGFDEVIDDLKANTVSIGFMLYASLKTLHGIFGDDHSSVLQGMVTALGVMNNTWKQPLQRHKDEVESDRNKAITSNAFSDPRDLGKVMSDVEDGSKPSFTTGKMTEEDRNKLRDLKE